MSTTDHTPETSAELRPSYGYFRHDGDYVLLSWRNPLRSDNELTSNTKDTNKDDYDDDDKRRALRVKMTLDWQQILQRITEQLSYNDRIIQLDFSKKKSQFFFLCRQESISRLEKDKTKKKEIIEDKTVRSQNRSKQRK